MGFVKRNICIEKWLSEAAVAFKLLTDYEYRLHIKEWRHRFEPAALTGRVRTGYAALEAVDKRMPCDVVLFTLLGYRRIPGFEGGPLAFGYMVVDLEYVDHATACEWDAIVVSKTRGFCCMYTHEWSSGLATPRFVETDIEMGLEW